MAERIQWRRGMGPMPEGARYVGRPSRWGNPWVVVPETMLRVPGGGHYEWWGDRRIAVSLYRLWLDHGYDRSGCHDDDLERMDAARSRILDSLPALRGHDLACACPLDGGPCHADVLLELANR